MFNTQLDLKNAEDLLSSPFSAFFFAIAFAFVFVIIGMSLNSPNKAMVCKEELLLIPIQEEQIKALEGELILCVSDGQTSCIEREQRICRKEKEDVKEKCNRLLDDFIKEGKR